MIICKPDVNLSFCALSDDKIIIFFCSHFVCPDFWKRPGGHPTFIFRKPNLSPSKLSEMKKKFNFLLAVFMAIAVLKANGQGSDYKVVFDITSASQVGQQAVVREAGLIKKANPDAQVEVVVYGQALDLLVKDKSAYADDIVNLVNNKVEFKACHIAMDHHQITESQLIPGVGTVPDGIYEIIKKQREGWGYIKVAF